MRIQQLTGAQVRNKGLNPILMASVLGMLLCLSCSARAEHLSGNLATWAVFYGKQASREILQQPDVLVLEADHGWSPATLKRPGQIILAYLSLGEVHETRPYFKTLQATQGVFLGRNPQWQGAWRVDPAHPMWKQLVCERLGAALLERGYDGLFLDTIDVAEDLERTGRRPGAKQAMVDLIKALHAQNPSLKLIANGGLAILPGIAETVSAVAIESVFTNYDFEKKQYRNRSEADAIALSNRLLALKKMYQLPVLVLEYVAPQDSSTRQQVTQRLRQLGLVPFVSGIELGSL
jgi:uncharacterized protein (TIGR01370 family)